MTHKITLNITQQTSLINYTLKYLNMYKFCCLTLKIPVKFI